MKNAILLILTLLTLISCRETNYYNTVKINIQSDTIITLENLNSKGDVFKLEFKIKGKLNEGVLMTKIIENSFDYKYELNGEVDSVFCGDWYSNTCRLKFENIETPVNLKIDYSFYEL